KRVAGNPRDYAVTHVGVAEASARVPRPLAYLIPPEYKSAVENLQRHGIAMEELREDIELTVQPELVQAVSQPARAYQKHNITTLQATSAPAIARRVPAGTVIVRTDQALGRLATFLLEPSSEDGLALWNFFDSALIPGHEYPVARLVKDAPMLTG